MGVQLAKSAIDLGIVVEQSERSLEFYVGLLGLEHVGDMAMPIGGGGTMHRIRCGDSLLKLVCFDSTPAAAAPGGIPGALGLRYVTLIVSNLDEMVSACEESGVTVVTAATEIRAGVRIAIVADPDGNWVEFVEGS
ncbi:VOC family protein [Ilumatobacter sp.]|uniref:VOC family protein n=1 Tax=Ilumatobacter sp. TaxID=1967498 RepID=UPI003B529143